ncbi:MAG: Ig-like domain-containing protein [Pseudomonadota bacterium]
MFLTILLGGGLRAWAAPTVVYNSPAADETSAYRNTLVTVIFSEDMDPATIASSSFQISDAGTGEAAAGEVTYNPDARSATFKPAEFHTFKANETYQVVIAGTVANLASPPETMGVDHAWTFTTSGNVDPDPPGLVEDEGNPSPKEDATEVARDAEVRVWFDEDMDPSSINASSLFLNGVSFTLKYNPFTRTAVLKPSQLLDYGAKYNASATNGLTDMAGNPLGTGKTWNFTTTSYAPADTTPPTVVSVSPAEDSTGVAVSTVLSAVFSEPMNEAGVLDAFRLGQGLTGTVTYRAVDLTAVFTPDVPLSESTKYTATITTTAADLAGNPMIGGKEWSFTTVGVVDEEPPQILSQTPPPGALNVSTAIQPSVKFSEPMDQSTINEDSFFMKKSGQAEKVSATITYQSANNTAVLVPVGMVALEDNTTYVLTISNSIADTAGLHPKETFSWSFATGPGSDSTPPTIRAVSPDEGAVDVALDAPISVTFDEDMNPSTITHETFGLSMGVSGTYSYNAETKTAVFQPDQPLQADTDHEATVTTGVRDLAGNNLAGGLSWTFTTYRTPDSTPPQAAIVSPADGAKNVALNSTITATFTEALNADSVNGQSFYLTHGEGIPVPASVSYSEAAWTASLSPSRALLENTEYTVVLTTRIADLAGNHLAQNRSWSFTTKQDDAPPQITSVSPENDAQNVALDTRVKAVFTEALDPSTVTPDSFLLKKGQVLIQGAVSHDSGSNTALFTPSEPLEGNSTYTASITTAVTDLAGNNMSSGYSWSFKTHDPPDQEPPIVTSTTPAAGAVGVAVNSVVYVVFSEEMKASTINTASFAINNGVTGAVSYSGTTAVFTPDSPLVNGVTYTAAISTDVKDLAGNNMTTEYSWNFTTISDAAPPQVTKTSPADGAENVVLETTIIAYFNEPMNAQSISTASFLVTKNGIPVPGDVDYDIGMRAAVFTPTAILESLTEYSVIITTAVKDAAGNPLASGYSWSFTTYERPDSEAPWTTVVTPFQGAVEVPLNAVIQAAFNEALSVASINTATFLLRDSNGVIPGTVDYDAETSTAEFTPGAKLNPKTTYTAALTTGITDLSGNALENEYTWTFTTTAQDDQTPPTVQSTTPENGDSTVGVETGLDAVFSEDLNQTTINSSTFLLQDSAGNPVSGTVAYDSGSRTAVLAPAVALANSTGYTARLTTGITDLAGNRLAADYSWSFTTAAEGVTTPVVSSNYPVAGAEAVPVNSGVGVTFDQDMDESTITAQTFTLAPAGSQSPLAGRVVYSSLGRTAVFTPNELLPAASTLEATLSKAIKSSQGLSLAADFSWRYETGGDTDSAPPEVSSLFPASNAAGVDLDVVITVQFNETLDLTSLTQNSLTLNHDAAGTLVFNRQTNALTLTPASPLPPLATHTAELSPGLRDMAGNELEEGVTWSFTTGAGGSSTPAQVIGTIPLKGAQAPAETLVMAQFSKALNPASLSVDNFSITPAKVGQVSHDAATNTVTFIPLGRFEHGLAYNVKISGIKDMNGLTVPDYSWTFLTSRAPKNEEKKTGALGCFIDVLDR